MFVLGFAVGIVGGIYGIGGGAIIAPVLVAFLAIPVYTVAGAALLGTFITSVAGLGFYQLLALRYTGQNVAPDWLLGSLSERAVLSACIWEPDASATCRAVPSSSCSAAASSSLPCDTSSASSPAEARAPGGARQGGAGEDLRAYGRASEPHCSRILLRCRLRRAKCTPHRIAPNPAMAAKMPSS